MISFFRGQKNDHVDSFSTVYGIGEIKDKIGPITIVYGGDRNTHINSIHLFELGRLIHDYLRPDPNTKVLEIGCSIGILGLMLSHVSTKKVLFFISCQSDN